MTGARGQSRRRWRELGYVGVLCFLLGLAAGRVLWDDDRSVPERVRLEGTVTGAADAPLGRAFVEALRWRDEPIRRLAEVGSAHTGPRGRFTVAVHDEPDHLFAWAPGYVPAFFPPDADTLRLRPAHEVRGVVRDDTGVPVAGARVRVHAYELEVEGVRGLVPGPHRDRVRYDGMQYGWAVLTGGPGDGVPHEARTDAQGRFAFAAGGTAGVATVLAVDAPGHGAVEVPWTGDAPLEVRLPREAVLHVVAVDAAGRALDSFRVGYRVEEEYLAWAEGGGARPATLRVPPGAPRITVTCPGRVTSTLTVGGVAPAEERTVRVPLERRDEPE